MFNSERSHGTDFLGNHTMLQVCHLAAAVHVQGITILAKVVKGECSGEGRMDVKQTTRSVDGVQ